MFAAADLRFRVAIARVDEWLAASVAVLPVGAGVAVFLTAAIPADAALGVLVWCAVFLRGRALKAAMTFGGFFFGFSFLALDVCEDPRRLLGFAFVLFGGALGVALRDFLCNCGGFERHERLVSHGEMAAPRAERG